MHAPTTIADTIALQQTIGYTTIEQWLQKKELYPFQFQMEAWQAIINGKSGLVNAPTGCGKTYSVFIGSIIQFINQNPNTFTKKSNNGFQLLWVTPLRALASDIGRAMEAAIKELGLQWKVGIRNGDTSTAERQKQVRNIPEILIITPESLHLLLAQKNASEHFKTLQIIAVDEWHELMGGKRGVQTELAVSRIVAASKATIWGISATIGNLEEATEVLLYPVGGKGVIIKADMEKQIQVTSIIPEDIEQFSWAGHVGIQLAAMLLPIIEQSTTTLIFINTRGMSETWYQTLLNIAPHLAGVMALHHGSIEQSLREWVEEALHTQKLKAVICTASLDLGVDFRPVDTVIQVGSPKGVARFLQRAGRSGHSPGAISKIYFLPTHALELVEAAALTAAVAANEIESKPPMVLCFDVLIQYLCTIALGEGFIPEKIYNEIKSTHCYNAMLPEEWKEVLLHITQGGQALKEYDEYKKVEIDPETGVYAIKNRRIAMRHRMHIGTIVSDAMVKVKLNNGKYIGVIEEYFISKLEIGTVFTFAGRNVALMGVKDMTAMVQLSNSKKSIVPSWMGGRMSLTANLGHVLRNTFNLVGSPQAPIELKSLDYLFQIQKRLSHIPKDDELLVEQIEIKGEYHLLVYPFEGRQVHEAMSAIIAFRIGKITNITFSIAMNDYGFELLSDKPIPVDDSNITELFSTENILADIEKSVNSTEMAKRKFRDIAVIGGLIFQGMPGEQVKARHLQSSAGLLFNVFSEFDANNVLLRQAYREVLEQQMEAVRLTDAMKRIQKSKIIITYLQQYTPLSFPIIADGLNRNNLSTEKLEDRIKRMQEQLVRG